MTLFLIISLTLAINNPHKQHGTDTEKSVNDKLIMKK